MRYWAESLKTSNTGCFTKQSPRPSNYIWKWF